MLETIIKLLERFVVAHELIAKTNAERGVLIEGEFPAKLAEPAKEMPVEGEDIVDTKPEDKPARKPRQTKPKEEPKGPDLTALRDDIKTIAKHIAAGESDECADKFDELLEDFKVRTVTKLHDDDVEEFHKEAKKLVGKYYEIED